MSHSLFEFFAGRRTQVAGLVLMRGETFMETIEDNGLAILMFHQGSATISRSRQGEQVGLHLTPQLWRPVFLTAPGTYCIVARDHTMGVRVIRTGGRT